MANNAVTNFHANSRLHFIGSWRARYDVFLDAKLAQKQHDSATNRTRDVASTSRATPRTIFHVDMDCFFASVAMRARPELSTETPLAVSWGTSASKRGEVSSANYAARAFGVKAGMWLDEALRLCPELVLAPYDFAEYEKVALEVYEILFEASRGECVGISCDEAFIDVTSRCESEDAVAVAEQIRRDVYAKTKCACSIGIGSNMLLARLATRRAKPDGAFRVEPKDEREFIAKTRLADLPGFGRHAGEKLQKSTKIRVTDTCETLLKVPVATLKSALGAQKTEKLLEAARGIDKTPWCVRPQRKSIGAQMSWGVRCASNEVAMDYVKQLVREVAYRMQRLKIRGRALNLKLWRAIPDVNTMRDYQGHGACDVLTRTKAMRDLSNDTELIISEALTILRELNVEATSIRGLGVSITKLEHGAETATSPGAKQPTLSQMFAKRTAEKATHEEETCVLAASDEELAETESEGDDDVADTQSQLTQNDCDFTLFNSQAEIDSDRERSIRDAFDAAARAYAWQRFELGRLKLSKRRRDTLSEDEYARRACARAADVIATQARRSYAQDGETGLNALLNDARALCRSQELLHETYSSQGAAFIAAWLDRVDSVGKTIVIGSSSL